MGCAYLCCQTATFGTRNQPLTAGTIRTYRKVTFSKKYVCRHQELTTRDLLDTVERIEPPVRMKAGYSEHELKRIAELGEEQRQVHRHPRQFVWERVQDPPRLQLDHAEQALASLAYLVARIGSVRPNRIQHLIPDARDGVECVLGSLEDHRALLPAEAAHLFVGEAEHIHNASVSASVQDLASGSAAGLRQQSQQAEAERRLARATLADQRDALTRVELEGRLLHCDHFGAGEIGHVVFTNDGRPCRCGNRGCLETVASAGAILRAVRAAAGADPRSVLHDVARCDQPLDMDAVAAAYAEGDSAVREVVHEAGRGLGMAIASLVGTLNVQEIVIAGGVTRLGEPLLDITRQEVLARCLEALARKTRIEFSAIGADITALGAAAVLLHQELAIWPLKPRMAYAMIGVNDAEILRQIAPA